MDAGAIYRTPTICLYSGLFPVELVAEGGGEVVAGGMEDVDGEGGAAQADAGAGVEADGASVDAEAHVRGTAGGLEHEFGGVVEHERTHGQRVRGDGSDDPDGRGGLDDGAADAQIVGGGACGSGHEEAVDAVLGEHVAVDGGVDVDHAGGLVFQERNLVEGVGPQVEARSRHLYEAAAVGLEAPCGEGVGNAWEAVDAGGSEVAEAPGVDSGDGGAGGTYPGGRAQEGAVAADAHGKVGAEAGSIGLDAPHTAERRRNQGQQVMIQFGVHHHFVAGGIEPRHEFFQRAEMGILTPAAVNRYFHLCALRLYIINLPRC